MKKFASLLLALVMCLCCLTTAALAERAPVRKKIQAQTEICT